MPFLEWLFNYRSAFTMAATLTFAAFCAEDYNFIKSYHLSTFKRVDLALISAWERRKQLSLG